MSTQNFLQLAIFRFFSARPRLFISIVLGYLCFLLIPDIVADQDMTKALIAWNTGVLFYLFITAYMMFSSSHEKMNHRAVKQDEGKFLILIFVALSVFFALGAIINQMSAVKEMHGSLRVAHIGLTILTILTSWFFTQTMFALHYAHDFYSSKIKTGDGGLIFPNDDRPDYADFLYFSFIIGTSAQTADINLSSKIMRRTCMAHCILAFFFNTSLLALTINIASGLI